MYSKKKQKFSFVKILRVMGCNVILGLVWLLIDKYYRSNVFRPYYAIKLHKFLQPKKGSKDTIFW